MTIFVYDYAYDHFCVLLVVGNKNQCIKQMGAVRDDFHLNASVFFVLLKKFF